jgi:hypothetical protein
MTFIQLGSIAVQLPLLSVAHALPPRRINEAMSQLTAECLGFEILPVPPLAPAPQFELNLRGILSPAALLKYSTKCSIGADQSCSIID